MTGVDKEGHPKVLALTPMEIPLATVHYREEGTKCARLGLFERALADLDVAFEVDPRDWHTVVMRARAALKASRFEAALEDATLALDSDADDLDALLVKARALYCLGEFEQALVMAHRGWKERKMPPAFAEMIYTAEETIEDCIGRNVGPIMLHFLEHIYMMEKEREEEELLASQQREDPCAFLDEDEEDPAALWGSVAQRQYRARLEAYMSCKYLGRLCVDRKFLLSINDPFVLAGPNQVTADALLENVRAGLELLQKRMEMLRERMPLYAIRYREAIRSKTLRARRREMLRAKREVVHHTALSLLERMRKAREAKDYKVFYHTVERAYELLHNKSEYLMPRKKEFLQALFNLAGVGFLDLVTLRRDDPPERRLLQAQMHMAVPTPRGEALDAVLAGTLQPRVDYKRRMCQNEARLKMAETNLERAWIYADMSSNSCDARRFDLARHYGRKCVTEARAVEHWPWCINADLAIAKSEMQQHNKIEALQSINEAVDFANRLQSDDVLDLLTMCTKVINEAPAEVVLNARKKRDATIVNMMINDDLKNDAKMLLQAIRIRERDRFARKRRMRKEASIDFSHLKDTGHQTLHQAIKRGAELYDE